MGLPSAGSCEQSFEALDHALRRFPGHRLFTVLAIDWSRSENRRVYSSEPGMYPCGGAKPLRHDSEFFQNLIVNGWARFCDDQQACRRAFPDYALIEALGCESAVNVPIRHDGSTIGSLNLLHQKGWYRHEMSSALMPFADLAATVLLRNHSSGI